MIISELSFFFSVYSLSLTIGHLFKIFAIYCIYKIVVQSGIIDPYNALLDKLGMNNNVLEERLHNRIVEIKSAQRAIFLALAKLAEARDKETGAHLKRLSVYTEILLMQMRRDTVFSNELNDDFIADVVMVSVIHDIGKVGLSESILLKRGKLTLLEFEEMKKHTIIGASVLKEALRGYPDNHFIKVAQEIAQNHHERWDGKGYPKGISGINIPLSARVVALADVFDALGSQRCYKKAFSFNKCKEIIIQNRNTHFDPFIVNAFLKCEKDFNFISENMQLKINSVPL